MSFHPHENFLGLDDELAARGSARVLVLPVPYEATVSYGGGTRNGPRAIIHASMQVELYDRDFGREVAAEYGVHTLPPVATTHQSPDAMVARIEEVAHDLAVAHPDKLIFALGGEHTVTYGLAQGAATARQAERPLLVQVDAHCDLRDEYEGSPYSHASVSRRLFEQGWEIVQLGIRSLCQEEADLIAAHPDRLRVWFAEEVHADDGWRDELAQRTHGRDVYLTIDIDGLDPSLVPATGTPEPDGLTWRELLDSVRIVAQNAGRVLGVDCVELAPIPGQHASEFITAKLCYRVMNLLVAQPAP